MFFRRSIHSLINQQRDTYKSIDFLPMWNYYQILDSDKPDYRYLVKGIDYENLPDIDVSYLAQAWEDIIFSVVDLTNEMNKRSGNIFQQQKDISIDEFNYYQVQTLILCLSIERKEEHIKALAYLGYIINEKKDFTKEVNRIRKVSQNALVKINAKKEELKSLMPKDVKKSNIYDVIDSVEKHRKLAIDLYTMPIKKWIVIYNNVIRDIEHKTLKNG